MFSRLSLLIIPSSFAVKDLRRLKSYASRATIASFPAGEGSKMGILKTIGLLPLWPGWRSALVIVKPETVIRRHRQGFKLNGRWKSRVHEQGRPDTRMEFC